MHEDLWLSSILGLLWSRVSDPVSRGHLARMSQCERMAVAEREAAAPFLTLPNREKASA